jgi:hypothetical protein
MIALRELVTVHNHQLHIQLPHDFNFRDVEVLIMPRSPAVEPELATEFSSIQSIGKMGMHSQSFIDDDEDYSQW